MGSCRHYGGPGLSRFAEILEGFQSQAAPLTDRYSMQKRAFNLIRSVLAAFRVLVPRYRRVSFLS